MTNIVSMATNAVWFSLISASAGTNYPPPPVVWEEPAVTVQVVTNVTHWSNEKGCATCVMMFRNPGYLLHHACDKWNDPYSPATEKTETVTITEIKTLRFRWNDKPVEVTQERVLSRRVKRWRRRDTWVKDEEAK